MSSGYSVTAVIPTYNRCELVERALASVVRQTRAPDEILIVDDGSTDETVHHIPARFPAVRYLRQDNRGVSAARNLGISAAKGEWLAFLDSDDEWLPHKLERQIEALRQNPTYRICHTNEIWVRRGRRVNPMKKHEKFGGDIFEKCLPLCIVSPSSAAVHKSVFERVGGFDESLPVCEDYDMWLRVTALYPVLYLNEPLIVKYGGHPDQLSRSRWGMDRFRIRAIEKAVQSGALSREDRRAAVRVLLEKIDVYLLGARKRERWDDVSKYQAKKELYRRALLE